MTKPQTLYRMFSADDQLLYVGITQRQLERFHQHAGQKYWWNEVARIEVQHYPDRETVVGAERQAIEMESPRYNVVWNGARQSPPLVVKPKTRDGYGYGAPTADRWRPESMTCTVMRKRGGAAPKQTELVLWWELDYETITDDYLPSEADCFELFAEWERHLSRRGRAQDAELPIWWFVVGPTICEYAEASPQAPATGHFGEFYYLGDTAGAYQMEVDALPVAAKGWNERHYDKGGFIQQATQWQPSPLQPTASLAMLRRRMLARRG